jgi:predicted deacylase
VYDDLAAKDALGLFRFLQGRGYIAQSEEEQRDQALALSSATVIEPTPLTGVDMIEV